MFFPHRLKKEMTSEELLGVLNEKTWLDGGKFEIVEPKQISQRFGMGYIVYTSYEDAHYATTVACYSLTRRTCYHIKPEVTDISGISDDLERGLVGSAIGSMTGNVGLLAAGVATGAFKHKKIAKKRAKALDKEIAEHLTKHGVW